MANFPTSLPSFTITAGNETANSAGGGLGLSGLLNSFEGEITAVATKIGTGSSTPTSGMVLTGNGAGTSTWTTLQAATTSQSGAVELAIASEIDTGTDSTRAIPVDQFVASARNVRYILYRALASTTATSASATVGGYLEVPITGTIVSIGAYVDTAGVTGTMVIDINKNGATVMTTSKCTIDTAETSTRTAATAPVLTTTAITAGDLITVDVDTIQTTPANGLTYWLGIRMT